jgi:hypothetical protein
MNALFERRGQSLRIECLDRILALGETHFNHLLCEYFAHYNTEQPHRAIDNWPLAVADLPQPAVLPFLADGIVCESVSAGT